MIACHPTQQYLYRLDISDMEQPQSDILLNFLALLSVCN